MMGGGGGVSWGGSRWSGLQWEENIHSEDPK